MELLLPSSWCAMTSALYLLWRATTLASMTRCWKYCKEQSLAIYSCQMALRVSCLVNIHNFFLVFCICIALNLPWTLTASFKKIKLIITYCRFRQAIMRLSTAQFLQVCCHLPAFATNTPLGACITSLWGLRAGRVASLSFEDVK